VGNANKATGPSDAKRPPEALSRMLRRGYPTFSTQVSPSPSRTIATLMASRTAATTISRAVLPQASSPLAAIVDGRPTVAVVSPTVRFHFGAQLEAAMKRFDCDLDFISLPGGEAHKNQSTVTGLLEELHHRGLSRDGVLVGIGGGVLLDVVGFTASQYRRGISHIKIGTTLLAQVDAAVGLKCGVNVGTAKNLAGAFWPPEAVLTDGNFLQTLPARDIRCGLAEMVKLGLATDATYFNQLETQAGVLLDPARRLSDIASTLVDTAIRGMVNELNNNPFEDNLRRRVDTGHTISPYIEASTGYDVRHGEAVSIDLAYFGVVSELLGAISTSDLERLLSLLQGLGLPIFHTALADFRAIGDALDAAAAHRGRMLRLPLATAIGRTDFLDDRAELSDGLIRAAATRLMEFDR
jgi:3-dehydroquinate synthetase